MMPDFIFSLDLEDRRPKPLPPFRFLDTMPGILDFLDERQIRGSIFVIGSLAQECPDLVQECHQRGHEIACHGWEHVPLTTLEPETFRQHVRKAKSVLEDIVGEEVKGFRAPMASMVAETAWAPEILLDEGYSYSSSVIPTWNPQFGFPQSPKVPYKWPCGLLEMPIQLIGLWKLKVPFLGATYFRMLPVPVIRFAIWLHRNQTLGSYFHPWDFDTDEPFEVMPHIGKLGSRLLWYNRNKTYAKIAKIFPVGSQTTVGGYFESLDPTTLSTFNV